MGRKKKFPATEAALAGTPAAEENWDEPLPRNPPADGATEEPAPKRTNKDLVQAALEAGKEKPKEAVAWLKEKFGVEMAPSTFSVTKSSMKKGDNKPAGGRKKAAKAPAAAPAPVAGGGDLMEIVRAAETIRALVHRFGADQVRRLVDSM